MLPAAKLKPKLVKLITEKLNVEVKIKGLVNDSDESTRLAFIFEQSTDLDCAISQVLFNKPYDPDEELSTEHTNEFNLYLLFFKGIGGNNFYFNESSLIDDIKHSVTLNDYCQRDHVYQQSAFAKETENYQIKNYQFSCDYWVRYINIAHELVYATVRSADMDLYS